MHEITVVGGGVAGLVAAIEAAEAGAAVRLLEARSRLGGRAESTPPPYVANLGPHALYRGTANWAWLRRRGLHRPSRTPRSLAVRFRWHDEMRRLPPRELLPILRLGRHRPPPEHGLRSWLAERFGPETSSAIAGASGALTFDHDPGRLSAAFVVEKIRRIVLNATPVVRYVEGGWGALAERLARHAASVGVRIQTSAEVRSLDDVDDGPVIVAVEPGAARRLLGDDDLRAESPRVALLDVGLERRRGDPYLVVDLDEAAFFARVGAGTPSHAPEDHDLVQAAVGLRPGEDAGSGHERLEAVLDGSFAGWRERLTWRRQTSVQESTGALDLPGTTWRDRSPVDYAEDVWLAGDWVAAPGHFSEVSWNSAVAAARQAVSAARRFHARPS